MKKRRNEFLLILTALIWGIAFVAQSEGGDAVGPFSFNCIRMFIGGLVLLPAIKFLDRVSPTGRKPKTFADKKILYTAGILSGIALAVASDCQQMGITLGAEAGKAGFVTACYVVFVPILGIFLKRRCRFNVWIGVALTVIGLYLLCIGEGITIHTEDILLLISAFMFAVQILIVDRFSPLVDGVRMACIQFFTAGILTIAPMIIYDINILSGSVSAWLPNFARPDAWISIIYAGALSCGVAYTLQIVGQNGVNPTVASLLMSLESVFAVLAGWIILGQILTMRALLGCALIFAAVILAQLNFKSRSNVN